MQTDCNQSFARAINFLETHHVQCYTLFTSVTVVKTIVRAVQ